MQSPLNFAVAFALAFVLLFIGAFFVRTPERVARIFSSGASTGRISRGFLRVVGWIYICGAVITVLMLGVATYLNFFHSR